MILMIWFGVYPAPLLNLIRTTTGGFNVASSIHSQKEFWMATRLPHSVVEQ